MTDKTFNHPAVAPDMAAIVYIREADREALPEEMRDVPGTPYALHDTSGNRIGLAADRRQAFALARRNDLTPVSVH